MLRNHLNVCARSADRRAVALLLLTAAGLGLGGCNTASSRARADANNMSYVLNHEGRTVVTDASGARALLGIDTARPQASGYAAFRQSNTVTYLQPIESIPETGLAAGSTSDEF